MSADVFDRYAAYYDLLYRDKDYAAEADYVARTLRNAAANTRTLLEFGSGTGRHGRLLAEHGFDVFGIERSKRMVTAAKTSSPRPGNGSFDCEQGDIGALKLDRRFDAVIALFHVMSYQTTDDALHNAFASASEHLNSGGLFFFDVWHGPAVIKQPPEIRTKKVVDANTELIRTAIPELHPQNNNVVVRYKIVAESRRNGDNETFEEEHLMRYFFPEEIASLTQEFGFSIDRAEEFMTGRQPSPETWGVGYLLRKRS